MNSNSNHDFDEHSNGFRQFGGFSHWGNMNWDEAADWGERGPGQRSPPSDAPISNSYHHSSASTGALQPPSASSRHQRQPRQHHQLGSLIAGPSTGASGSGAPLPIGYNMSSPSVPNMTYA
eukprot:GEMP01071824.1.p1 GENE.GEMP01071824.1~~GEMP01071824.1.p1  ORF type:complete len:121 (+),score=26.59 GEMP01071824.1:460-822(+)